MARTAIRSKDYSGNKDAEARMRKSMARVAKLKGKTFETLSQKEKDGLLKMLALRAGLLEDSEDQD